MEKLIKDNILVLFIAVASVIALIYTVYYSVTTLIYEPNVQLIQKEAELQTKEDKLAQIRRANSADNKPKKKESESGKVIYEVLGQQFSAEASFGIMFENILSNIANSGVKIRTIEYNYQPIDDKVLMANIPGYNVCELAFTSIATYSQLQTFFKNIAKENYLSNLYEVFIEPYDRDKTLLIAKFKVRLYTKTI